MILLLILIPFPLPPLDIGYWMLNVRCWMFPPFPLLHHYHTDHAIEAMRPVMKMDDGSYVAMLMPAHILLLRWLGQLSSLVPVGVFIAFLLSFLIPWPSSHNGTPDNSPPIHRWVHAIK